MLGLCVNDLVELQGLASAPELNGSRGVLEAWDATRGRWGVRHWETQKLLSVASSKLRLCYPSDGPDPSTVAPRDIFVRGPEAVGMWLNLGMNVDAPLWPLPPGLRPGTTMLIAAGNVGSLQLVELICNGRRTRKMIRGARP